jgi:hypothetical protein
MKVVEDVVEIFGEHVVHGFLVVFVVLIHIIKLIKDILDCYKSLVDLIKHYNLDFIL